MDRVTLSIKELQAAAYTGGGFRCHILNRKPMDKAAEKNPQVNYPQRQAHIAIHRQPLILPGLLVHHGVITSQRHDFAKQLNVA